MIISGFKRKFLFKILNLNSETKKMIESEQLLDEIFYQHNIGLYEYHLFLRLFDTIKTDDIHNYREKFLILLLLLNTRKFNIFFIIASVLLPIVFYYLFVLIDYLEAIEELLSFVKKK